MKLSQSSHQPKSSQRLQIELEAVQAGFTTLTRTLRRLAPPPKLTVSEWSDQYRYLSAESSAEPGRWRTDRAEYQRGILDAISDPATETVVVCSSAQVGKTEILNNAAGYHIHQDPAPMLVLQPTIEMGEAWSKDRLAPMLRDSRLFAGV
jgi:phage terminase large subunit GpA-like protein